MTNTPPDKEVFRSWDNVLMQRHQPEEVDCFYRYFGAFAMFNSIYKQDSQVRLVPPVSRVERERIESFAHPDAFGNTHMHFLSNDNEYETAVEFIAHRSPNAPVWMGQACRIPTVRVWNLQEKYKDAPDKQGVCANKNDLTGLLGCRYVARCNLFHGSKEVGNRLDVELVENGYKMLRALLHQYSFR